MLELGLTEGAARTEEFKAPVDALALPVPVVYGTSSAVSYAALFAAVEALPATVEQWTPDRR